MVSDNGVGSKLVAALISAKKEFKALVKNKRNPHFGNMYADLSAVHEAVDEALANNGLTVMQPMEFDQDKRHVIKTTLAHVSGEERASVYPLPGGVKSQELASAITYGRRNSLCALLGIAADDDDDGEATEGRAAAQKPKPKESAKPPAEKKPAQVVGWVGVISAIESPANGKWKITAKDGTVFGTVVPEHAEVARTAITTKTEVRIVSVDQSNGVKRITAIEPVEKEASNG